MIPRRPPRFRLGAPLAIAMGCGAIGCAAADRSVTTAVLEAGSAERGRSVYRKACSGCHGASGDGRGPASDALDPKPRNLMRGVYRYRATPTGSLPRREDLARTVLEGVPGTAMPAWRGLLGAREVADVVVYVESLCPRFGAEEVEGPVTLPAPAPYSADAAARGRKVYEAVQCGKCHGETGRGDGWARDDEMKDDEGQIVHARDFTKGIYRGGVRKEDLYRTLLTGLDGSPMPSYEGSLAGGELTDLVSYLLSFEQERGLWYWLSTPPTWLEPSEHEVAR